jgi:hypothetical protein
MAHKREKVMAQVFHGYIGIVAFTAFRGLHSINESRQLKVLAGFAPASVTADSQPLRCGRSRSTHSAPSPDFDTIRRWLLHSHCSLNAARVACQPPRDESIRMRSLHVSVCAAHDVPLASIDGACVPVNSARSRGPRRPARRSG